MKQNVYTGDNPEFYRQIKESIQNADSIDIIVSFFERFKQKKSPYK